jgi:D-alanyl-D-alanine carboxypeptidase (penicillin-binding protein 5/6)
MKKINVLVIASALITIHVIIFIVVIGRRNDDAHEPAPAPSKPVPTAAANPLSPETTEFQVPELKLPEAKLTAPAPRPAEPVPERELIGVPVSRDGYLRSDRPVRRTKTVYSKLVGDPYQGAIVVDARSGRILYENKAAVYAYPASVTKMMTMLIVLEQIDAGVVRLDDRVRITKEIAGIGGSGIYLDVRESGAFTVHQMLEALMIHSANDAAAALAVHVAGSTAGFVEMMNHKARELGMNSTTYHTPHGLPLTRQPDISTAYDIALLSLACLRHPETIKYTGTKLSWIPTNSLRKERFMLANRNHLVGKDPYPGCDGLKTGYHSKGGYSLAATAKQGGDRVIAVVLGAPDRNTRNNTIKKLMDQGFSKIK